jgi:hypothetical protein
MMGLGFLETYRIEFQLFARMMALDATLQCDELIWTNHTVELLCRASLGTPRLGRPNMIALIDP